MRKKKKNIKNRKLKQKINNNHFLLRFHITTFDVIFVQVIFSMLGVSSYNFENKGKYYLCLWSTESLKAFCQNFPFILVTHERILGTFFFLAHQIYFEPKKIILNYIKSLCVELLQIFSDAYFETRRILDCIKSLSIIFCVKMTRYSQTFLNYIQCLENVSILQNDILLMH